MSEPSPAMRRLAQIDSRAAALDDPALRADVVCLVRLIGHLMTMHAPTADGRRCGECGARTLLHRRRDPAPCRTRWLLEVILGR